MLTRQDCLAFCDLDEDLVLAVAGRWRLPVMPAAERANHILSQSGGVQKLKQIVRDDIVAAEARQDFNHALKLKRALNHFSLSYPDDPASRQRT